MNPVLQIKGLSYRYPDGYQALRDICLEVSEGQRVAIIGPNGAGKSTLFWHLNGTFQGEGDILVMGQPMIPKNLYVIRKRVGLVFQDSNDQLFMPTVFEDVAFGPMNLGCSESEVKDRVENALRQVGMAGTEAAVPHHLSIGQRKKVAIATVLAMDPQILAFDEPSSGLDPRSRRSLIELLKSLPQPQLIATHDLDFVLDVCQRVILMDQGRIVAEGKVPDFFRNEALLIDHGMEKPLSLQR